MAQNTTLHNIAPIDFNYHKSKTKVHNFSEVKKMDDLLKAYIEKVDRDQDSLRQDIRESERRLERYVSESEDRMDKRFERLEKMLENQNNKLNEVQENVDGKLEENKRFMWGIIITILLSIIASIGVIVATYMSTISLLQNML